MLALLASALLGGGIASAGYFISQTVYNAQAGSDSANVRGLAERRVQANKVYWTIGYSVSTDKDQRVQDLYPRSEAARDAITRELVSGGLAAQDITQGVVDYHVQEFRDRQQKVIDERHTLQGTIEVESDDVVLVKQLRAGLNKLATGTFRLDNRAPRFLFTQLNQIKPDMLREATRNARIAATEFADNAGVTVGGIRQARQGNFVIRDAGVDYGDAARIEKIVRVVTSVDFYLVD